MLSWVTVGLLLAAPVKVAVPEFTIGGLDKVAAQAWAERFVTLLGQQGALKLTTQRDITQALGLERQAKLTGCEDTSGSCLAELAGALGVDAILSVSLIKGGTSFTATVRVIGAGDGAEITALSDRLPNEDAVQDWLETKAPIVARRLDEHFRHAAPGEGSSGLVRWVPAIGGAALAIGGATLFGLSRDKGAALASHRLPLAEIPGTAASGRAFESSGLALMIAGGVAIAASAVWVIAAPKGEVHVALAPMPEGAAAFIGASF